MRTLSNIEFMMYLLVFTYEKLLEGKCNDTFLSEALSPSVIEINHIETITQRPVEVCQTRVDQTKR